MQQHTLVAIATLAGSLLVSGNVRAQNPIVSKGDVAGPPSFPSLVAAINFGPSTIETLKSRASIKASDVTLVNARALAVGQSDVILNMSLQRHASEIEQLQAILARYHEVSELLSKEKPKVVVGDVIAVDPQADGKLVIYYRTKS